MWKEQEVNALSIGLKYDEYWEMYPVVYESYVKAHELKQKARMREWDMMNYMLGRYLTFAFNQPKNYPRKPFLDGKFEDKKEMTDEEMEKMMKRNTKIMGGTVNES